MRLLLGMDDRCMNLERVGGSKHRIALVARVGCKVFWPFQLDFVLAFNDIVLRTFGGITILISLGDFGAGTFLRVQFGLNVALDEIVT